MKRPGFLVAAFVFLGGILRLASPGASTEVRAPRAAPQKQVSKTVSPVRSSESPAPKTAFEHALADEIAGYYGCHTPATAAIKTESERYWNVPKEARSNVQFLIAVVPDPVHTHLGMLFDRTLQALQQGVQQQGDYSLDRSILPWRHSPDKSSSSAADREKEEKDRAERESFPGLLIFRGAPQDFPEPTDAPPAAQLSVHDDGCATQRPLFAFLVAETPTSGIRVNQFQNSLAIMRAIRSSGVADGPEKRPLYIFGPSFSGSLESLNRQLHVIPQSEKPGEIFVYSGNVTSKRGIDSFQRNFKPGELHFAPFQENDDLSILQFARFAASKGYEPKEIAVLSEDDTAYGQVLRDTRHDHQAPTEFDDHFSDILNLHFPREISFFRSAYEKELAAKQETAAKVPGKAVLPLNLEDEGTDDDAIPPYAGPQTSLSQEAVMLGVVSELQKHHIKFTILLATNPLDQLFLARYLRDSYPQGRVVVTVPDLLLVSQEDSLLQGVLGLNVYSLVPGQSDLLQDSQSSEICPLKQSDSLQASEKRKTCSTIQVQTGKQQPVVHNPHQDRLFESTTSVGDFNAMVGLLSAMRFDLRSHATDSCKYDCAWQKEKLPAAAYVEYSPPCTSPHRKENVDCHNKPLTWLTILGHDGYWPITALSDFEKEPAVPDRRLPISRLSSQITVDSTLLEVDQPLAELAMPDKPNGPKGYATSSLDEDSLEAHTTPAWNIAYCICLIGLALHLIFSWTGTFLSNSEMQAQFANTHDKFGVFVMAAGAFWLVAAFVIVLCARSPLLYGAWFGVGPSPHAVWRGGDAFTALLWLPLFLFIAFVHWDLAVHRKMPRIAWCFSALAVLVVTFQLVLAYDGLPGLPILWSTRYLHFASGVSPIPPFLFLCAVGYWWVWLSLRALSIVDLRRPRLPAENTLPRKSARISDSEGEKVRDSAHPIKLARLVLVIILGVYLVSLTVLDLRHPLQSLEGYIYDWGYTSLLAIAIAVYLGCLIRLTRTWFSYKQVLTGLDRSPLREAFSRMKRLSWKSMWNPSGSTLRETYRVMSRTFENLEKLEVVLEKELSAAAVKESITATNTAFNSAMATYLKIVPSSSPVPAQALNQSPATPSGGTPSAPSGNSAPQSARVLTAAVAAFSVTAGGSAAAVAPAKQPEPEVLPEPAQASEQVETNSKQETKSGLLQSLVEQIEILQIKMADTAGFLIRDVLTPLWQRELEPVVSTDRRVKKGDLSLVRALGEEYAALIYVNFLQSILLQMRTLVICAAGMYILIVCSISIYPFEPHPALQVLSVVLLVVAGTVVGFVYAEMHRDAILGRLTSTNAGELGWDFWLKLVSAGALPVFSLLAVQFPEIGRFLFSWLEPLLQSAK